MLVTFDDAVRADRRERQAGLVLGLFFIGLTLVVCWGLVGDYRSEVAGRKRDEIRAARRARRRNRGRR